MQIEAPYGGTVYSVGYGLSRLPLPTTTSFPVYKANSVQGLAQNAVSSALFISTSIKQIVVTNTSGQPIIIGSDVTNIGDNNVYVPNNVTVTLPMFVDSGTVYVKNVGTGSMTGVVYVNLFG